MQTKIAPLPFMYQRGHLISSHMYCEQRKKEVERLPKGGTGNDLSSRAVSSQVLSALESLTTVFGMGTGGTSPSLSPVIFRAAGLSSFSLPPGLPFASATVPLTLTTAHPAIQVLTFTIDLFVSFLLVPLLCFAFARFAPLPYKLSLLKRVNEAFDRLVSTTCTCYHASSVDLSTW